jgi:hypothetical protein
MARQLWVAGFGSDQRKRPAHDRIVGRSLRASNDQLGGTHQQKGGIQAPEAGEDAGRRSAGNILRILQPSQNFIGSIVHD